jgi:hypothetical protein
MYDRSIGLVGVAVLTVGAHFYARPERPLGGDRVERFVDGDEAAEGSRPAGVRERRSRRYRRFGLAMFGLGTALLLVGFFL